MLTGTCKRLTAGERAREPRSLAVVAWFDGWAKGSNPDAPGNDYPRRLTPDEEQAWREGWREGHRERVCHSWHGFLPCSHADPHPATVNHDKELLWQNLATAR